MLKLPILGSLAVVFLIGTASVGAYAQSSDSGLSGEEAEHIPSWVRTLFVYYAEGHISDYELLSALEYLIGVGVISVPVGAMDVQNEPPPDGKIPDVGDFYMTYLPNPNSAYEGDDTAIAWLKNSEMMEYEVEFLNENFRLPHDVEIVAEECGEANAFYYPDTTQIVICYEFIDDVFDTWYIFNEDSTDLIAASNYAYDVLNFIFFHEVAHAIIDVYDLPVTGIEENVADQFASLMLSYTYDPEIDEEVNSLGQDMLYNVGTYYLNEDEYWNVTCPELAETPEEAEQCFAPYWDEHNLDIQRFYNISCYAYGADPEYNQDLIGEGWLPEERAANCEYEYYQIDYSWSYLLDSFTNGFFDSSD